MTDNVEH